MSIRGPLDKVDDPRTPRELWDPLNGEFEFTPDAAASDENAFCRTYFTHAENDPARS